MRCDAIGYRGKPPHLSERAIPKHALQPGRRMQDLPSDLLRLEAKIFSTLSALLSAHRFFNFS